MKTDLTGVLNLAKPAGMMSRRLVDKVLSLVAPAKVGHAGTLDPMATGVLVVCVGAATRFVPFVQEQPKQYLAEFVLGCTSDTDDVTGKVVPVANPVPIERATLEAALTRFVGRIEQTPPDYSAARIGGQRAYDLARRGKTVDLAPKIVEVSRIAVLNYQWPRITVEIDCGSGTYVRSIGRDLGQALGCGAVMSALERTRIGPFTLQEALPFERLDATTVLTALQRATACVPQHPVVTITDDQISALRQGRQIVAPEIPAAANPERVCCVDAGGHLIALCDVDPFSHRLQPKVVVPKSMAGGK